jgi:predicted nucleotidyltransferase
MVERQSVLKTLRRLKPGLQRRYRVRGLSLFGSVARGDQTAGSDIDVLVDFEDDATLFDLSGLGLLLEEELQCRVDVVPRRSLRDEIRDAVLSEAVNV